MYKWRHWYFFQLNIFIYSVKLKGLKVPKQEEEIKKMEEKLKLLNWKHQPVTGSTILVTDLSHMLFT